LAFKIGAIDLQSARTRVTKYQCPRVLVKPIILLFLNFKSLKVSIIWLKNTQRFGKKETLALYYFFEVQVQFLLSFENRESGNFFSFFCSKLEKI